MGRWEHRYLGWERFPDPSTPIEIEQLFTLEADELACAKARRTPLHRLAVALHIVFLKTTGRLLNSVEIVPVSVLEYLGRQLGCTPRRCSISASSWHAPDPGWPITTTSCLTNVGFGVW